MVEIPPAEVQKVKDIINALVKAIKISKMYPSNNPIYQKFIEELKQNFDSYMEEHGNLQLRLTQFKAFYKDAEVYDNPDKLENITFKLFADGIRELTFHEELENDEILGFLDVLNANIDPENSNDDMVTLLWEKNFQHITYFVIEDAKDVEAAAEGSLHRTSVQEFVKVEEMNIDSKKHLEKESGMPVTEVKVKGPVSEAPLFNIYTLTEEEIDLLKKEKEAEENPAFTFKIIDILYEILYLERDIKSFSDVVRTLDLALDLLISKADFVKASRLLKNLREIAGAKEKFSEEEIGIVNQAIDRGGDGVRIGDLGAVLSKNQAIDLNALSSYLSLLNKNAIGNLLELLEINNLNLRKHLCDVIVELVKDDIGSLAKKINDKRWYIVRNIVYIFGKLGNTKAIEYLKRTLKHDEPRVRIESVKSLITIGGEQANDLLITALADNDIQVSLHAVRGLVSLNHKKAVQPLIQFIGHEGFKNLSFPEKREFFEALGRLASDEAVDFLKNILGKRHWFRRSTYDEIRACAAYGLGKAGDKDILALLEGIKEKPGTRVETARLKAIAEIKGSFRQQ